MDKFSEENQMIEEEIVKGNPDGTINPLGNTTRAEAAVIMSRIFDRCVYYKRFLDFI